MWISFELNEPAEVGIVKLKNCPGSVTGINLQKHQVSFSETNSWVITLLVLLKHGGIGVFV